MRLFVSFRAQRSGVEKSGFRLNLLLVRSQISPLQAAPRPSGRDDRGADCNPNWYNVCYEDEIAGCVGMMQAQKPDIISRTYSKAQQRPSGVLGTGLQSQLSKL